MKNPVNWFEIPVNDLDRAMIFYQNIFQIEISPSEMPGAKMGWFPFEENGAGATGTLIKADYYVPSYEGSMVYSSVEEINDVLPSISENGGNIINEKFSIGEHGFCAHFGNSEGNTVDLHQSASVS